MQRIGVVAIAYNESANVPGFLACLASWVDEVVVVDDGSTDDTAQLLEASGFSFVRVLRSPRFPGEYFADQRNKGIAASTVDWILHMDLDERVSPTLATELINVARSDRYDAFKLRRSNFFLNRAMKGGGWQGWVQVHFARRSVLRFEGMFHESVVLTCPEDRVGILGAPIFHLNESSFLERLVKSDRYREEVVRGIEAQGSVNMWSMIFGCVWCFIKKFIIQHGWRDGTVGFISAGHSVSALFRAYAVVWDRQNACSRETLESRLLVEWSNRSEFQDGG